MAAGFEAFRDGGVGRNVVGVLLSIEQRLEDRISVALVGYHNVLIATARANEEAAGVICV